MVLQHLGLVVQLFLQCGFGLCATRHPSPLLHHHHHSHAHTSMQIVRLHCCPTERGGLRCNTFCRVWSPLKEGHAGCASLLLSHMA